MGTVPMSLVIISTAVQDLTNDCHALTQLMCSLQLLHTITVLVYGI